MGGKCFWVRSLFGEMWKNMGNGIFFPGGYSRIGETPDWGLYFITTITA